MFLLNSISGLHDHNKIILPVGVSVGIAAAIVGIWYSHSILGSSSKKSQKKDAAAPKISGPKITVWFGSQTGTAEEFAKTISKEGAKRGFDMKPMDLERFDPASMAGSNAIFLVATYGEGDPTDNARSFYTWMTEEAQEGDLHGMQYSVFGLGNSQYEHYNTMGRKFDKYVHTQATNFSA
jgi:NADPH-ferrihemoprotein reductase